MKRRIGTGGAFFSVQLLAERWATTLSSQHSLVKPKFRAVFPEAAVRGGVDGSRFEQVRKVFSAPSSTTPLWGTIDGDRHWWTGTPFARLFLRALKRSRRDGATNAQGGQHSEAGQQ